MNEKKICWMSLSIIRIRHNYEADTWLIRHNYYLSILIDKITFFLLIFSILLISLWHNLTKTCVKYCKNSSIISQLILNLICFSTTGIWSLWYQTIEKIIFFHVKFNWMSNRNDCKEENAKKRTQFFLLILLISEYEKKTVSKI